ncbi:MAG: hypothetical protein ACYC7D_14085 [Nitrososphaerales archaeon]
MKNTTALNSKSHDVSKLTDQLNERKSKAIRRISRTTGIYSKKTITTLAIAASIFALFAISSAVPAISLVSTSSAFVFGAQPISAGFLNGAVGTATYFKNFDCDPSAAQLLGVSHSTSNFVSGCEAGAGGQFPSGAAPLWILVPAYAGLSVFGVTSFGASPLGYPTFQNHVIRTDCGAGTTATACPDHPSYTYSPAFTAVEQYLGITSGTLGLPEGVLPTPAHTHIINTAPPSAWFIIVVLVFDPNIMPQPATGHCNQFVSSALKDPTDNCLTSLSALKDALTTQSSAAISHANAKNPIWLALGKPTTQVVIPGDSTVSSIGNANTNIVLYFNVTPGNPYAQQSDSTST